MTDKDSNNFLTKKFLSNKTLSNKTLSNNTLSNKNVTKKVVTWYFLYSLQISYETWALFSLFCIKHINIGKWII